MEPDFDKLVSNKIHNTERQPVSWNKQAVWAKLQPQTQTRRHYHGMYSVAAAVILLLLYFTLGVTSNTNKEPSATDTKMAARQEAQSTAQPVLSEVNSDDGKGTIGQQDNDNESVRKVENSIRALDNTQPLQEKSTGLAVQAEPVAIEDMNTPVVAEAESASAVTTESAFPEETMARTEKIKPIVGVVIESPSTDIAKSTSNRPRFKLQSRESPPDPIPWQDHWDPLVFAVNK